MSLGTDSVLDDIVHPDRLESIYRFFPTDVTIQRATITQRPNGEQVKTWATLTTAKGNLAQRPTTERRGDSLTIVPRGWALNLKGYYPTIARTDRVLIGSDAFNIVDVVHDSLSQSTRLDLEVTTH